MFQNFIIFISLLSPVVFCATAIISWFQTGLRPLTVKRMSIASTIISLIIAGICAVLVINNNLLESGVIGFNNLGISFRLDAISVLMLTMIALLGFIIVRFSIKYLDGDKRQGIFIGRLAATIASIQLLVLSGNLILLLISWILTSISLHRLLVFYSDRPGAIIAAKKKFVIARLGDVALFIACFLLYNQFGSDNLEVIFTAIRNTSSSGLPGYRVEAAALFLVIAAVLKSAQFPTHGWLVEIMETPTPVSALLHAGLLNAGPFLIIRMAYVMECSNVAPTLLILIGGFTALFASVAYLTQTSVKTALAYSSVAHMGFSLMVCGMGVYSAAMLHLVAHSFYKAHAFLSSGSVIDVVRASKLIKPTRLGSPFRIAIGIAMALTLYIFSAIVWEIDPEKELSLLFIGAIMIMGLSRILTSAIDSNRSIALLSKACILSIIVVAAFFSLEAGTRYLLASQLPELLAPESGTIILMGILLFIFGIVVFIQIVSPILSQTPFFRAIAIHLRNGLYANALFDRIVGALLIQESGRKQLSIKNVEHFPKKK